MPIDQYMMLVMISIGSALIAALILTQYEVFKEWIKDYKNRK